MNWVLIGVLVWVVVALLAALVLGSSIRSAEQTHDADEARTLAELDADERIVGIVASARPVRKKGVLPYTGPEPRPFPPPPSVSRQRRGVLPFHVARSRREPSPQP